MKFQRTYRLTVQGETTNHAINYPFTLYFETERGTFSVAQRGMFKIYNLGPDARRDIYKDAFNIKDYRRVELHAGYFGDAQLPLVFRGNILQAFSARDGADWVTTLECWDGGFGIQNGQAALSVPGGTSRQAVVQALVAAMPRVSLGAVAEIPGAANIRGMCVAGRAWDLIQRWSQGFDAYVCHEQAFVLSPNMFVRNGLGFDVIDSRTGLLGTPRRTGNLLEVDTLFEPRAYINQLVDLRSEESVYNGAYVVKGYKHRGWISGQVCRDLRTTFSLYIGDRSLGSMPLVGIEARTPAGSAVAAGA